MKTIITMIFACVLVAAMPSCKKCYTCTITGTPGTCTCYNGTNSGSTYYGTVAQAEAGFPGCVTGGGYWQVTTAPISASSTKHCYNTSGPLGGALNGQASAESQDQSSCENNGGTWTAN